MLASSATCNAITSRDLIERRVLVTRPLPPSALLPKLKRPLRNHEETRHVYQLGLKRGYPPTRPQYVGANDFSKKIVDATVATYGKINHIINNAGFTFDKMLHHARRDVRHYPQDPRPRAFQAYPPSSAVFPRQAGSKREPLDNKHLCDIGASMGTSARRTTLRPRRPLSVSPRLSRKSGIRSA
ncbi:hypothetical protein BDZ89DRAFT_201359 [Hymenopellis radicata]|nr:hypothetical protein BDZ89DRAFT_201359 [Hymenopellis radicata]